MTNKTNMELNDNQLKGVVGGEDTGGIANL